MLWRQILYFLKFKKEKGIERKFNAPTTLCSLGPVLLDEPYYCTVGDAGLAVPTLVRLWLILVPVGEDHTGLVHARHISNDIELFVSPVTTPLVISVDPAILLAGDD